MHFIAVMSNIATMAVVYKTSSQSNNNNVSSQRRTLQGAARTERYVSVSSQRRLLISLDGESRVWCVRCVKALAKNPFHVCAWLAGRMLKCDHCSRIRHDCFRDDAMGKDYTLQFQIRNACRHPPMAHLDVDRTALSCEFESTFFTALLYREISQDRWQVLASGPSTVHPIRHPSALPRVQLPRPPAPLTTKTNASDPIKRLQGIGQTRKQALVSRSSTLHQIRNPSALPRVQLLRPPAPLAAPERV